MASMNGPTVMGTDGTDFQHRERVASQYKISAVTKWRLKLCVALHALLFVVMLVKLSADILDKLDIFILEIEELQIPQPLKWEYIWTFSVIYAFFAFSACKKNSVFFLQIYIGGTATLALAPVLFALCYYLPEAYHYISTGDKEGLMLWQGQPYALLNMAFLAVALQVHAFSLAFSAKLVTAWKSRGVKKAQ